MDLMSLAQLLGNLGEFIGAFAIVVALGGVYFQVRQSNVQARATSAMAITQGWQRTMIEMAGSESLGRAYMNVTSARQLAEVSAEDAFRVTMFLASGLKNAELCYLQYQNGGLDEEIWVTARDSARSALSSPMIKEAIWPPVRLMLSAKFGAHMAELIEQKGSDQTPFEAYFAS